MKQRFLYPVFLLVFSLLPCSCENLKDIENLQVLGLSTEEIANGLKEALNQGAKVASENLGVTNGYFMDQAVKIFLPADAAAMIEKAYSIPLAEPILKPYLETVVEKMNRGAEKAATKAVPIFASAITSMSFSDAMNILKGDDTAATGYLRKTTWQPLTNAFAPEINTAMEDVGAASAWNTLFTEYNSYVNPVTAATLGLETINPDLGEYATEKALNGLFLKVAGEEKAIRNDPTKRVTDLMKRVFKEQD
jgi:hypothetical protein